MSKSREKSSSTASIDAVDRKILRLLQGNGRISVAELAQRVGLSSSPCWNRLDRLERAGIVKGYRAVLDNAKLGLPIEVLVQVTLERHADFAIRKFVDALAAIPEVIECVSLSGPFDALLRVLVPDLPAFEQLLMQRLSKVPGVTHFSSSFVLNRLIERAELPALAAAGGQK